MIRSLAMNSLCGFARPLCAASVLIVLLASAGCIDDSRRRVAVSGTVTLDGEPVNDATIIFTPSGKGLAAAATIVDGKFQLTGVDGPTIGSHGVRINPNEAEMEEADPASLAQAKRRPQIPKVYQRAGELTAILTGEPQQQLTFELSRQPQ